MESYRDSGFTPKIETTDNAFKIILPNRNVENVQNNKEGNRVHESFAIEEKIVDLAKKQGLFSRREAEQILGISQSTCIRILKQMQKDGKIMRQGNGKATRYRLP